MSSPVTKIIYCCYGGTHSSAVAAAIHMGRLPRDRTPTWKELMSIPFFDRMTSENRGQLLPAGIDPQGRQVFVLGRGPDVRGMVAAVRSGWMLAGGDPAELKFIDTLKCVNWLMRIGGFLSRALGLVQVGRPVVLCGTQRAYPALLHLVKKVEGEVLPSSPPPAAPEPVYR